MLSSVYNQIIRNRRNSDKDCFVSKYLEETNLSATTYKLINSTDRTVSDVFFAKNFIETSLKNNTSSFTTILNDSIICNVYFSIMINNGMNILIGKVHDIDFIIAQHVTSCDFIYFPQYNYIKIIAHSNLEKASNELLLLTKFLKVHPSLLDINDSSQSALKGFILSHARPYHFFYDCAAMVHKLYENKLLEKLDHFQTINGNFIDFTELYDLNVSNHVVNFNDLNHNSEIDGSIFFKVGLKFSKENTQIVNLIRDFDSRLNMAVNKLQDTSTIYNEVLKLKKEGYFVLWFGISTDKRSLENQIELLNSLVVELKKYHNICVVIDGWTVADSRKPLNPKLIESDINVLKEIQSMVLDTEFISLIGETSATKIAVSTLIDFHVSSGATGSIWPARFGKKEGVFHNSQAFYKIQKSHIRYRGIDYPNSMVQDVVEKVKRIDYVSYNINESEFIEFIVNNYPNIFDNHFDYLRFNIERTHNLEVINLNKGEFSSLNNDPQFIINIEKTETSLNNSEYTLSLIGYLKFEGSGNHKCNIYLDYGEGFNAGQMVQAIVDSTSEFFEIDIKIEKPLKQLRFDPTSAKTNFIFKGLFYKIVNINNKD